MEGRQGTRGVGMQGTPAIFLIIYLFLIPNMQEGGFGPRDAYRHNEHKTDAMRGGKPLPGVFPSTQTRCEGVLPLRIVVSFHTDATRGGKPLSRVLPSTTIRS